MCNAYIRTVYTLNNAIMLTQEIYFICVYICKYADTQQTHLNNTIVVCADTQLFAIKLMDVLAAILTFKCVTQRNKSMQVNA